MLHAIAQKKSHRHKNYHLNKKIKSHRTEDEKNIREEDEITSTILGPLDFLSREDSYKFWKAVIGLNHRDVSLPTLPSEPPIIGKVSFWPKNVVEPDAFFQYEWADDKRLNFLIELKWNAPLTGEDQLARQWDEFLTKSQRSDTIHVFIAPDITAGINAINNKSVSPEHSKRIVPLSWSQICEVFERFENNPGELGNRELGKWSQLCRRFLSRTGVSVFKGFSNIISSIKNSGIPINFAIFQACNFGEIANEIGNQEITEFCFTKINIGVQYEN